MGRIFNRQLDEMTHAFINDPARNHLRGKTLQVSKIFDWFRKDFSDDVIGFIIKYANPGLKQELAADKEGIRIRYLDQDWSLNGY